MGMVTCSDCAEQFDDIYGYMDDNENPICPECAEKRRKKQEEAEKQQPSS